MSETISRSALVLADQRRDQDGVSFCANAARVEGRLVEDVYALELSEDLETLQTGGLLLVGRDLTGLRTWTVNLGENGVTVVVAGDGRGSKRAKSSALVGRARSRASNANSSGEHGGQMASVGFGLPWELFFFSGFIRRPRLVKVEAPAHVRLYNDAKIPDKSCQQRQA